MKTTRKTDTKVEREVARWMDAHFYGRIANAMRIRFQRVTDARLQFRGCDVFLGQMAIDEKCKYRGLRNQVLQYPSFELSFIGKDGRMKQGWFAKTGMMTTHYVFISVFTTADTDDAIREDNIERLVLTVASKKDVVQLVKENEDDILKDGRELVAERRERKTYHHDRYWLKHSMQLQEEPVNLVMRREVLLGLPHTYTIEVTKEGIRRT